MITVAVLRGLFPALTTPEDFIAPIQKACATYRIDTDLRLAGFLAQTGHESAGLRVFVENLNYSTDGLLRTFPRYFPTRALATAYARNPQRIANRVYANRMGNGNEASGEGWRFRGKGAIQITGRYNTQRFADSMGMTIDAAVEYMLTKEGAVMSAAWFWASSGCNACADVSDITALTEHINGGHNGLAERQALYERARRLLGVRE